MHARRRMSLRRLHQPGLLPATLLRVPDAARSVGGLLAAALALSACDGGKAVGPPDLGDDDKVVCAIDSSKNPDSAYSLTLGETSKETICPRNDVDYWSVPV